MNQRWKAALLSAALVILGGMLPPSTPKSIPVSAKSDVISTTQQTQESVYRYTDEARDSEIEHNLEIGFQRLQEQQEQQRIAAEIEAERVATIEAERVAELEAQQQRLIEHTNQIASRGEDRSLADLPLFTPSGLNTDEVNTILASTALAGLGEAFVEAEAQTHINTGAMIALAQHESGNGTSYYARTRHNLFGFGADYKNPDNAMYFLYAAQWIADAYIAEDGIYYQGGTLRAMNVVYAPPSPDWADKVAHIWASDLRHIK
jgi:beta-N-acetylglucosaminidase